MPSATLNHFQDWYMLAHSPRDTRSLIPYPFIGHLQGWRTYSLIAELLLHLCRGLYFQLTPTGFGDVGDYRMTIDIRKVIQLYKKTLCSELCLLLGILKLRWDAGPRVLNPAVILDWRSGCIVVAHYLYSHTAIINSLSTVMSIILIDWVVWVLRLPFGMRS